MKPQQHPKTSQTFWTYSQSSCCYAKEKVLHLALGNYSRSKSIHFMTGTKKSRASLTHYAWKLTEVAFSLQLATFFRRCVEGSKQGLHVNFNTIPLWCQTLAESRLYICGGCMFQMYCLTARMVCDDNCWKCTSKQSRSQCGVCYQMKGWSAGKYAHVGASYAADTSWKLVVLCLDLGCLSGWTSLAFLSWCA